MTGSAANSLTAIYKQFKSSARGLSTKQAKENLKQYGLNTFTTTKKKSDLIEYLNNFTDPMVLVLIIIAVVSYLIGETINGLIITCMVFLSVTLNFIEEHRAGKAAQKVSQKVALISTVMRDDRAIDIQATKLVPGDVLVLNAGDLLPADALVIESKHFFCNQGVLTGESFPVEKNLGDTLFAGTSVTTGTATAVITKTGLKTEFSHVVSALSQSEVMNDFTLGIHAFSQMLIKVIFVLVVAIFILSVFFKHTEILTAFTFAIAVAVGLTPEFLPMILSVTMAKGAVILAKKGIIVKKLVAIPAFGSMDVLCTDKTGTLTEDKIHLVTYTDIHGRSSQPVLFHAYLNSALESGITNPLDNAIKAYKHLDISQYQKIDEIPFDFERRKLSLVVDHHGHHLMVTKGAPETIIEGCTYLESNDKRIKITPAYKERLTTEYQRLSKAGFRVLAISIKELPTTRRRFTVADEANSTFLGFTSFLDPVKPNIKAAIDSLEGIGIEMKVISGDNELVCQKICADADINVKGILLGTNFDGLSDAEATNRLEKVSICARFSPTQKDRAISLLRHHGHVVGYLGDGINDAPSLKSADVGISVSNAVDIAKESADFIMTHKNLADLQEGVIAGRTIFNNTMKYLLMGLSSNFGNMFSMLGAVLFLPFLPMLPLQILLNNFLYDFAQITIPTDRVDPEAVHLPQKWDLAYLKHFMFTLGPISSLFDFISFGILYYFFSSNPAGFQTGWFIESLATQTLVIYVIRTRKIPFLQSSPSLTLLLSTLSIVVLGWLIPYLPFAPFFSLIPLPLPVILILIMVVFAYLLLTQLLKKFTYQTHHPRMV